MIFRTNSFIVTNFQDTAHLLRIPLFRNVLSSFLSSQGSNLLFFLGLPGIIRLVGGRTSGYAVTSHTS